MVTVSLPLVRFGRSYIVISETDGVINPHILITGGTGLIGRFLAGRLTNAGYRVTTMSRSMEESKNHIQADLTDEKFIMGVAKQLLPIHTLIHCAAIAHGEKPPRGHSVADFNTLIVNNVLKAFGSYQLHWIFMSSISVYGDFHSDISIPLTREPEPTDSYGIGKLHDEALFISNCGELDILRLMPVYGGRNLKDIRKRVFFPNTDLKILVRPAPLHSVCSLEEVLTAVKASMNQEHGQRISQVGDSQPISQAVLGEWFPGRSIFVPQLLIRAIVYFLPERLVFFRKISAMLKKFGLNNIYEVGYLDLKSKKN